jgi:hypothetical protein
MHRWSTWSRGTILTRLPVVAFALVKTGSDGKYALWAPAASNPFTVIASKDGWIAQTKTANIRANKTTTVNFALNKAGC